MRRRKPIPIYLNELYHRWESCSDSGRQLQKTEKQRPILGGVFCVFQDLKKNHSKIILENKNSLFMREVWQLSVPYLTQHADFKELSNNREQLYIYVVIYIYNNREQKSKLTVQGAKQSVLGSVIDVLTLVHICSESI